jgi:hypothetical protein
MDLDGLLRSLEATGLATTIRENESLFPWIESVHVLAITLVVGSIAVVDLRLTGLASRERSIAQLAKDVLPLTWVAFATAAVSGALLFSSNAFNYAHNGYFQAKFAFLLLAGVNMSVFHLFVGTRSDGRGARIAGIVSLLLWICIVAFGRWTGFTIHATPTGPAS